jgi:hypothetical protein
MPDYATGFLLKAMAQSQPVELAFGMMILWAPTQKSLPELGQD